MTAAQWLDEDDVPQPSAWAQRIIARGGTSAPEYGTPAWEALADTDPRKAAAAVAAAERWRQIVPTLAQAAQLINHLDDELNAPERLRQHELDARTKAEADRIIDQTVRSMGRRREPVEPRPMVQTDDWPTVRVASSEPLSPLQMLQRMAG